MVKTPKAGSNRLLFYLNSGVFSLRVRVFLRLVCVSPRYVMLGAEISVAEVAQAGQNVKFLI